ncbi:hypothetical protein EC991_001569 [Linnemannia zychae]|nr:hypothetical protein EC991_001569 [Linnemannia zychae]
MSQATFDRLKPAADKLIAGTADPNGKDAVEFILLAWFLKDMPSNYFESGYMRRTPLLFNLYSNVKALPKAVDIKCQKDCSVVLKAANEINQMTAPVMKAAGGQLAVAGTTMETIFTGATVPPRQAIFDYTNILLDNIASGVTNKAKDHMGRLAANAGSRVINCYYDMDLIVSG